MRGSTAPCRTGVRRDDPSSSSSSSSVVCVPSTDVARWVDGSVLSRSATRMYCNSVTVARQLPRAINSKYSMHFSLPRNPLLLPYKVNREKERKKKWYMCHVAVSSAANLSSYLKPESYPPHLSTRPTWTQSCALSA